MEVPDTVSDAVRLLESVGYATTFELGDDHVHCGSCGSAHAASTLTIDRLFRFEGPSDPADEAIVLGVACPGCGERGVIVSAFGPDADAGLVDLVRRLRDMPS